jgi:hypothetical protein
MYQYAIYRYVGCDHATHLPGHGLKGGRAFRIQACELNKYTLDGQKGREMTREIKEQASPCSSEQIRIFNIDQECHRCSRNRAYEAGYPLNTNYALPVAQLLTWEIPFAQARENFEGCKFAAFKFDSPTSNKIKEEIPTSPKSRPPPRLPYSQARSSRSPERQSDPPTTSHGSTTSAGAIQLPRAPVSRAQ